MDISEIRDKYNNGGYSYKVEIPKKVSENHVFDEELSVKRNRELVKEHNDNVDRLYKQAKKIQGELNVQFSADIDEYIRDTYGLGEAQARAVKDFVYSKYHSCMYDYFYYIDEFAEFVSNIINMED